MADITGETPSVYSNRVQKAFRTNHTEEAVLSYRLKCLQLEEKTVRRFLRQQSLQTWDTIKNINTTKSQYSHNQSWLRSDSRGPSCGTLSSWSKSQWDESRGDVRSQDDRGRRKRVEMEVSRRRSCLIHNCPTVSREVWESERKNKRQGDLRKKKQTGNQAAFNSATGQASSTHLSRYTLPPLPRSAPGFSRHTPLDSDVCVDTNSAMNSRPSSAMSDVVV